MNRTIEILIENRNLVLAILVILSAFAIYRFGFIVGEFISLITK
ncbi:Uncharacterised protein [Sphingobacterium mizutaii]|uniref:Uncharacterized protein n=1 Tax=Sphingobacterium mizutaii TaxID=1010 RepID=A0AAJ4XBU7_9SPHI|nr:hypothetical protein SAMN05192578_1011295 [Sphingobacterium mizutaii]SNV51474.1 Uncharacterised protein [Sphingobacterium mizutaii]